MKKALVAIVVFVVVVGCAPDRAGVRDDPPALNYDAGPGGERMDPGMIYVRPGDLWRA